MASIGSMAKTLSRFRENQNGGIAVMFALSVVPLLLAGGAAIDYLRYANSQTRLQAAVDAAALAVAASGNLTTDQRIAAGKATFARDVERVGVDPADVAPDFTLTGKTVEASASFDLPVGLMQLAGFSKMTVSASTEIHIPEDRKAEIALVLDYSGSMTDQLNGQVKYVAMKNAAKKLISDLEAANPKKVKIGLVPFSHHVYVTLPKAYVVGQSGTGDWTGCTQDRKYPYNLGTAAPTADDATKWGQAQAPVHIKDGCAAYPANNLKVMPLTADFAALRGQLDKMKPYAWTHIALGAEFGYHLLSPDAPFTEGTSYADNTTRKILVLLTDGMQTEPGFGPGLRTVTRGEKNLEAICDNAKADGITIMTVAYNIDDSDTVKRLKTCTTDPAKHFFDIGSDNNVSAAFEEIKNQITAQVYISK